MESIAEVGEDRRDSLGPLLDEIDRLVNASGGARPPRRITLGGQQVELDEWERNALCLARLGKNSGPVWVSRLAEGLAFRARCASLVVLLDRGLISAEGGPSCDPVQEAAVGLSLLTDLQRDVDRLVVSGDLSAARGLTAFRNRLQNGMNELRGHLGPRRVIEAERRSATMVAPPPEVAPEAGPRRVGPVPVPIRPTRSKRTRRPQKPQTIGFWKTPAFALVLLVLLVVLVAARFVPGGHATAVPELTRSDFRGIAEIRSVQARPPSLFIGVNGAAWDELDPVGKEQWMLRVGAVARAAGYRGATVKNESGRVVANWFRGRGTRVVEKPPASSGPS